MRDGSQDLRHLVGHLAARLPAPLAGLARVAYNYRWCWTPDGPEFFRDLDSRTWERCQENPVRLLAEVDGEVLERAAADPAQRARAAALIAALDADLARPSAGPFSAARPAAFFCAEFGIHVSLPIYAGGLGVLAGDFLKEASDRALALVGVGLLYRNGSFHQRLDPSGMQQEYWIDTEPERLPMAQVTRADGAPLTVTLPFRQGDAVARVWRVEVGRVPLFLLDTDAPENERVERWITARLYDGNRAIRLGQYATLGLGGVLALRAMGIEPALVHLNEGHAALAGLALAMTEIAAGTPPDEARRRARARTVFTTHTPVAAGNEGYGAEEVAAALGGVPAQLGLDLKTMLDLGRLHPGVSAEPAGLTPLAIRSSRAVNGVSARHGAVAREMWRPLFGDRPADQVPIAHVTNGVHVPTWMARPMRELLERHLGADLWRRGADPAAWAGVEAIPDAELWEVRGRQRADLVRRARGWAAFARLRRGDQLEYVEGVEETFTEDCLTLGFGRRIATYKRLYLLVRDEGRALGLLKGPPPVQLVLGGKAHPSDLEAKAVLAKAFATRSHPVVGRRTAFLDDYDMNMAAAMVAGCDVWINLPRPPLEASGTSGMKAAMNGGLNLSVLDGWWAEAYDGGNGWAIEGAVTGDLAAQDDRHAAALYELLEKQVVPLFHDRPGGGPPAGWLRMVKQSLRTLGPRFCATRMLAEYVREVYAPGAGA